MKQQFGVFATFVFGVVLIFPGTLEALSASNPSEDLTITVRVYIWARVSPTDLEKGQAVVSKIFSEAGIRLSWTECPCLSPPEPTALSVRIIPKLFGSWISGFPSDALGFAAATREGGVLATVFCDRVESLTRGGEISRVLGLAIAHELGHLLLGSAAHIDEGIMRPHWPRKDLRRDQQDRFRFTAEQAETIRTKVMRGQMRQLVME
jgi:hypothetical protein